MSDFTASLIYGACQLGVKVNIEDLAVHTLLSVTEYAAKVMNTKGKEKSLEPATSFSELAKKGITRG